MANVGVGGTLVLLTGVFLLAQASPRLMLSRAAQVAILPMILATAVLVELGGALGQRLRADARRRARGPARGGGRAGGGPRHRALRLYPSPVGWSVR